MTLKDDSCQSSSTKHSENVRSLLDLPIESGKSQSASAMTSSLTSSLASPGDSGFIQLDSETDTASFSEIVFEADSSSLKEVKYIISYARKNLLFGTIFFLSFIFLNFRRLLFYQ